MKEMREWGLIELGSLGNGSLGNGIGIGLKLKDDIDIVTLIL